jgi:hypothetical protein
MRLSRFLLSIGSLNNDKSSDTVASSEITGSLRKSGEVKGKSDLKIFVTLRDEENSETKSEPSQGNYSVMIDQDFGSISTDSFQITGSLSAITDTTITALSGTRYSHGDALVIAEFVE